MSGGSVIERRRKKVLKGVWFFFFVVESMGEKCWRESDCWLCCCVDYKIKETTKFIMYVLCRISLLNVAVVSYDVVVDYDIYIVVLRCSLLVIITRLLLLCMAT